jgi:predicted dinucleotide-binding enzyme
MRVGFLGAGRLAQTLGKALIIAHHQVVLTNSRGPETLTGVLAEMGPNCSASTPDKLKDECEVVILAFRWNQRETALTGLPAWDGTIVVDTLNNRMGPRPEDVIDLGDSTASEVIAALLPGAKVVKAFNHAPIPTFAEPDGKALFYCGDDVAAKAVVASLIADIGGTPIDTGALREGGKLQGTGHRLAGHGRLLGVEEAQRLLNA